MLWNGASIAEEAGTTPRANRLRINVARNGRPSCGRPTVMGDLLRRMLPLERADFAEALR